MNVPTPRDEFTIEHHGEITLIITSPALENIDSSLIEDAAGFMLEPLENQETPLVVFDLSDIDYFGSAFLSLLLRCWKMTTLKGGQMALASVSPRARELLRITSLDMIWPLYSTRREAMEAMLSD